ncbi:hypothetical protein C0993_009007 [Termitomyces sp. T159_Od127]|nr:hypothetical protein C0993_009007 [Termitomyces sp. T159_Od127]
MAVFSRLLLVLDSSCPDTLARTHSQRVFTRSQRGLNPSRSRSCSTSSPRSRSHPRLSSHLVSPLTELPDTSPNQDLLRGSPTPSASSLGSSDILDSSKVTSVTSTMFNSVYTAEVLQASASHAPIIGHKGIVVNKQVEKVLYNVDSSDVRAWVQENEEELKGLTFPVFMLRLRGQVLATDWEWATAQCLTKKQGEEERFAEWASNLREVNDTLINNKRFYIPTDRIHNHLLLHCLDDLRMEYSIGNKDGCYNSIKDFSKWLKWVGDLDLALAACKTQMSKQLAASIAALTKAHLKNMANTSKGQAGKGAGVTGDLVMGSTTRVYVYPLTAEERKILDEHRGCYQCRKVYIDHRSRDCPDKGKLLTLADYDKRKLTPAFAEAVRRERMGGGDTDKGKKGVVVNAVFEGGSDGDSSSDAGSEYVFPHHITYSCMVSAPFREPVLVKKALIDTGSPPALISQTLVTRLGLPVLRMARPLVVSGAFTANGSKDETVMLLTYTKLVVISPCSQWESRSQIFIICPDLHSEMILGLAFLRRNKLVIDPDGDSVIDKRTGFDLLHPSEFRISRREKLVEPHMKRSQEKKERRVERKWIRKGQKEMKSARRLVHFELNALFARESGRFAHLENNTPGGELLVVGMV